MRERFPVGAGRRARRRTAGFAGGNNAGAREARGALRRVPQQRHRGGSRLAARAARRRRRGVAGSRWRRRASSTCTTRRSSTAPATACCGGAARSSGITATPAARRGAAGEVFGVCGAACLMPKAVFDELGGFDEDFFASHEDVDLSYRARLRGYRVPLRRRRRRPASRQRDARHDQRVRGVPRAAQSRVGVPEEHAGSLLLRTLPGHLLYNAAAAVHFARLGLLRHVPARQGRGAGGPAARAAEAGARSSARGRVGAAAIGPHARAAAGWPTKLREKRFDVRTGGGQAR